MKKLLVMLMCVVMLVALMPTMVFAATPVNKAVVNGVEYDTVNAAAAVAGDKDVEIYGKVELVDSLPSNVTINFVGKTDDATIALGNTEHTAAGSTLNFTDLKLTMSNENYKGFYHSAKTTFTDCTLVGTYWTYESDATFTRCTFTQADATSAYLVWVYGSKNVTFTDCYFDVFGKAVLVYNESANGADIKVAGCEFVANEKFVNYDKAAIEVDCYGGAEYNINVEESEVDCLIKGKEGSTLIYDKTAYNTGDTPRLETKTNNVVIAHEIVVKDAKDATCTAEGYTGDKYCVSVGCEYEGKIVEKGKAIEKVAHTYKDGKCTVCKAADPNAKAPEQPKNDVPATGDMTDMMPWLAVMAVAAIGAVKFKKREN